MTPKIYKGSSNAAGLRFAVVVSRWNDLLTSRLLEGSLDALASAGAAEQDVEVVKVPGAFELPLAVQKVAETGRFEAVIALGVVIRGETPHFDFVAGEAAGGLTRAALKTGVPILFGVITADTVEQAMNRSGIKSGNKGFEAAMSAVEMATLFRQLAGEAGKTSTGEKVFPHVV